MCTFGVTHLKQGIHTHIDYGSNMGGIPPSTSLLILYKGKKCQKNEILNKDPLTHFNIYFGS